MANGTAKGGDPLVAIGDAREWTDLEPYREFVRLGSEGQPVALVTILDTAGSAPRSMGAAMAVRGDGSIVGTIGGGNLELLMIRHALEAMKDGRPRRYHYDFSGGTDQNLVKACIGKTGFFVQPYVAQPHLIIFGAGHIGQALAPMAVAAGFRVSVADDRRGYPDPQRFPESVRLLGGPFRESIASLAFDRSTYIVVVTYGHAQDEVVVRACLHKKWRYLGMIGSRAKVAQVFENLGVDEPSRRRLEHVRAPIGLPLGGRSPGEIAVGIIAEIVGVRHGQDLEHRKPTASQEDPRR